MALVDSTTANFNNSLPITSLAEGAPPPVSAVSWSAVIAGAIGAAALSLILLFLGSGLGLGAISPWANTGMHATAWAVSAIAWLTFTQLAASALGGYLTGRLRMRWTSTHEDEIYFRDTAHGFLSWAVATLITAGLLASAVGSVVGAGMQVGTAAATHQPRLQVAAQESDDANGLSYLVDSLFRKEATAASAADGTNTDMVRATPLPEATRIFATAARAKTLPPQDATYLAQLVVQRSGLSQADAEKRVNDTFAKLQSNIASAEVQATEAAEKARKASSYAALWFFIALLAGAFIASYAATFGGNQRDTAHH